MRSLFVLRVYARVHVRALSFSYVTFGVASHLISSLLFSFLLFSIVSLLVRFLLFSSLLVSSLHFAIVYLLFSFLLFSSFLNCLSSLLFSYLLFSSLLIANPNHVANHALLIGYNSLVGTTRRPLRFCVTICTGSIHI